MPSVSPKFPRGLLESGYGAEGTTSGQRPRPSQEERGIKSAEPTGPMSPRYGVRPLTVLAYCNDLTWIA